jgi:uncharacterized protein YbjT (DUF2867 family)
MLGSRIAHPLLAQRDARVWLLKRDFNAMKHSPIDSLLGSGVMVAEGDLRDRTSLDRATRGIVAIVSATQGNSDIVVDGQVALVEAGKRSVKPRETVKRAMVRSATSVPRLERLVHESSTSGL